MPCHLCHARQSDPVRGASQWKRAVAGGAQVLVCPLCQRGTDWQASMDRCSTCESTALIRALGETTCRACGSVESVDADTSIENSGTHPRVAAEDFAGEVDAAIRRVLGDR